MKVKVHFSGRSKTPLGLMLTVFGVALNGLALIISTLFVEHRISDVRLMGAIFSLPILAGLTLLYLSSLLARRKQTAWAVSLPIYGFVVGLNLARLLFLTSHHHVSHLWLGYSLLLPLFILAALIYYRDEFRVKSDLAGFRQALLFISVVLAITFVYGTVGFTLMDERDFHHEIGWTEAAHRTIDQFDLTTSGPLVAYSRRARVFEDSLSVVSVGALFYGVISLFQPLKMRLGNQKRSKLLVEQLLTDYPASSEDFFKLWPKDKHYFFTPDQSAALALQVRHGVALVVGDPAGQQAKFPLLLKQFSQVCYGNDWRPAFIHTTPEFNELYAKQGFNMQKIGEEALLNLEHFTSQVRSNKYFRHINNKFTKLGYSTEFRPPPHELALLNRLRQISEDWLAQPGRVERGLMMGYFSNEYMQQCNLMLASDKTGKIQAFLNQVPSFDEAEANFDLLRHTKSSLGNINDYLLMAFIDQVQKQGFGSLNLGLSPLAGMDKKDADYSILDSTLRFAYANGDLIYSFKGLHRFKAKYEPSWSSRYIVYAGGIRNFTRVLNALNSAMKVKPGRSKLDWRHRKQLG